MNHLKLWENFNTEENENEDENDRDIEKAQQFQYMMLSRLETDVKYFLGHGRGSERVLYYGDINEHIEAMKKLWDELKLKPEWLSYEDILDYEEKMINYHK